MRDDVPGQAKKELEKWEASSVAPAAMFKEGAAAEKYSQWDEQGVPTHAKDGTELSKKQRQVAPCQAPCVRVRASSPHVSPTRKSKR